MDKFKPTTEGFSQAIQWAKTITLSDGISLYDFVDGTYKTSEEKLSFINRVRVKS